MKSQRNGDRGHPTVDGLKDDSPERIERRAYTRPEILGREPLEAFAVACTPAPPGKGDTSCSILSS